MPIEFDDPVKDEVWATLRSLNDAWTKGDPGDPWWLLRVLIEGGEACVASRGVLLLMRQRFITGKRPIQKFNYTETLLWQHIILTWEAKQLRWVVAICLCS